MAFEELKQRQSFVWGAAPFENIETQIAAMHDLMARAGADVTESDLFPALVENS